MVTTIVLNQNDISKGGKVIQVSCMIVGRMKKVAPASYKQVYCDDGTCRSPNNAEGLLRWKVEDYFARLELTDSREGSDNVPALEEMVVNKFNEGGE